MAAYPIAVRATENQRRHPIGSPPAPADAEVPRYRFGVVAPNIADAVTCAGGLICDGSMAGWEVTVLVAGAAEGRAMQILGATVANLGRPPAGPAAQMRAVATDLCVGNRSVRDLVLRALNNGTTELLLWGRRPPPRLDCTFRPVGHRPSVAAQAFKAHALAAQPAHRPADMTEERFLSRRLSGGDELQHALGLLMDVDQPR